MVRLPAGRVTHLLNELGRPGADTYRVRGELYSALYPELKKIALGLMREERSDPLLQPTALVHEAYLKLVDGAGVEWKSRAHFLGVATHAMRQVLVDYARRRGAAKRGAGWRRVSLADFPAGHNNPVVEIVALDQAIDRLGRLSERMALVAECRIFGGMTHEEIAEFLSVSVRTATNDWSVARRWLARELADAGAP